MPAAASQQATSRLRKPAIPASSAHPTQVYSWIQEGEPDEVTKAKNDFNFWLNGIAKNEALFEKHVYKNPHLTDLDLVQHRSRLYGLLSHGEQLIVTFYMLGSREKIDPASYFKLIQENIETLLTTLDTWHGPLEAQQDIPEDFKEGIRDIAEGKIVDLDKALNEKPDNAAQV